MMAPTLRVMSLHALVYCERLFFLEEVEEIRIADERVYAGRELHEQLPEDGPLLQFALESEALGIRGKFDALTRKNGRWIVVEHKRGRSWKGADGKPKAWDSDRVQAVAYGLLLAEAKGIELVDVGAELRYHADHRTVPVTLDSEAVLHFQKAVERARDLRERAERPQPTVHANRCIACSLAPVCLPEEERLARDPSWDAVRLFPSHIDRIPLHVIGHGHKVGRSQERLVVSDTEGGKLADYPIEEVGQVVLHGNAQITTQALSLCMAKEVQVHWISAGGRYQGGTIAGAGGVQRRIRQYEALSNPAIRLNLARRLVETKVRDQLRHLLRATRGDSRAEPVAAAIATIRAMFHAITRALDPDLLRGAEGECASQYWTVFPSLLREDVPLMWRPNGRTRRPPRDACNALLSFCYQLLYRDVTAAVIAVGLEPSHGFYHTPRSQAYPLVEDLMELFRVPVVDLAVVASLNRLQWDARHARDCGPAGWLLTDLGRALAIEIYERRKAESWKHPVTQYSISYARMMELEIRLLEKEYTGSPGLFAKRILR